jgi:hypothetical protein
MGSILKQRNFFVTKTYELTDRSLKLRISTFFSLIEEEIAFEEITHRILRKKLPNFFTAIPAVIFFICTVLTLYSHFFEINGSGIDDVAVYAVLLLIFSGLTVFTYENEIKIMLANGKYISFYPKSPTEKEVNSFLETMKVDQKTYLLRSYAKSDSYLSPEQLANNIKWLWDRKIIDNNELDDLRNKLLPKPNGGGSSVGFTFNPTNN